MISPTPPRARSAKYAASRSVSRARSSRPVCIEPMITRLRSVVKPRSNGDNRFGYGLRHGIVASSSGPAAVLRRASRSSPLRRGCRRAAPGTGAARRRSVPTGRGTGASRIRGRCRAVRRARRAARATWVRSRRRRRRRPAPRILTASVAGARVGHRAAAAGQRLGDPAGEFGAAGVGDARRPSCPACPAGPTTSTCDPAVVLHGPQRAVDLLMGGGPEVADRPVESAGQLVAGAGLLAQRHQDRVGEGHARQRRRLPRGPMQLVALQRRA